MQSFDLTTYEDYFAVIQSQLIKNSNLIPDYFSTVEICQKENIYQVDFEIIQIIREAIPLNKDYISTTLKRIAHKKIKG